MTLEDVLTFLSCPECALSDLMVIIAKAVDLTNAKLEGQRIDMQVTAIEQTADMLEAAKLKTEGKS